MDNFDLKKYLAESKLLKEEEVDVLGNEFLQDIQDTMKMYYKMNVDMDDIKDWVNMYYIGYNSEFDEGPGDVDYEGNEFGSEDYESEKKELVFDTAEREDFYMHLNPEADSTFPNLAEGKLAEDDVFRDKKGSFRNQYSIGKASDIYDDFETYYERWEDEFVEGNSFNFDDEDEWNETNTPGDKVASHSWEIGYEEEDDYYKPIIYNMLNYLKKNKIYKYKNDDGIDAEFTFDDRGNSIDMVIYYTANDIEKYS